MDYSNLSQPWQEQKQLNRRIPLRRSPSYFYAHHPENWELILYPKEEKKGKISKLPILLPMLSSIIEEAGTNGIRMNGNRPDSSVLKTRMKEKGWTLLDPNEHDYLRLYPAQNGGHYYSNRFTKLENLAGRIIKTFDQESYNEFRRGLMLREKINFPHNAIIQLMLIDQNRLISKMEQHQHTPEGAARLKAAKEKYNNIENAALRISKMQGEAYAL